MTKSNRIVARITDALASAGLVCSWMTSTASAAELCDGRVCPPKFECRTEVSTCPTDEPTCVPLEDTWCASPECRADADCPSGMRCLVGEKLCRPMYELPCNVSADCGPGFTCQAVEGVAERYCGFSITACTLSTASSDCASGWTCVENVHGLCPNPGDPHTGCNPGDPEFVCLPPYLQSITTALGSNGDAPAATKDVANNASEGGCAIGTPHEASESGTWLLMGLFGSLFFARRRSPFRRGAAAR